MELSLARIKKLPERESKVLVRAHVFFSCCTVPNPSVCAVMATRPLRCCSLPLGLCLLTLCMRALVFWARSRGQSKGS